jgi:hypothetical protein
MISPHLLHLDASYSYRTYLGCLEGAPSRKQVIEKAKREAKDLWGERATFVIEPKESGKHMPTWTHMVWATGPAKDNENHGSELVVIWWSEMSPDTNRVLDAVDWEKHAKDFQY